MSNEIKWSAALQEKPQTFSSESAERVRSAIVEYKKKVNLRVRKLNFSLEMVDLGLDSY